METGNTSYDEKPIIGSNMSVELCLVCGDRASGRHYGAISCEGCKGFFKRSIRKQLGYQCRGTMNCEVTKHHRNRCQFCRLQKCLASGMRSDSVQHERKPIIDKKEIQTSSNSSNNSGTGTGSGGGSGGGGHSQSGTAATTLYHHRNKVYQQQATSSYHSSSSNAAAAAAAVASSAPNVKLSAENISAAAAAAAAAAAVSNLNVFPVGFNFADLTQTFSKRALLSNSYQQQQQDTYKYSPGTQTNDDDSMDNSTTGALLSSQSLMALGNSGGGGGGSGNDIGSSSVITNCNDSSLTVPGVLNVSSSAVSSATTQAVTAAAAANIIQSSFGKNLLAQSLELIATIQQQYDRSNSGNSAGGSGHNCQNVSNANSTTIVKEEILIDDHSQIINQQDFNDQLMRDCDEQQQQQQQQQNQREQEQHIFELPILPEANVNFNLQCPAIVPPYLNVHYVCESGSRLLFLSVYWIKKIPAFQQLSEELQIKLLRYHWVELFTIGLAQCSRLLSISTIMQTLSTNILQLSSEFTQSINTTNNGSSSSTTTIATSSSSSLSTSSTTITANSGVTVEKLQTAIKIRKMSEHAYQLNEFIKSMQSFYLDEYEYAYIRLMLIFSPDGLYIKDQMKRLHIEKLQEYALNSLKNYYLDKIQNNNSNVSVYKSDRRKKILLRLMLLRSLESDIIEELFFSNLIGQVQIEKMIPYILKLGGGGI